MAIALGADMLMLPMFRTVEQVKSFFSIVRSRVPVILLVETVSALDVLDDILSIPYDFDIHIGPMIFIWIWDLILCLRFSLLCYSRNFHFVSITWSSFWYRRNW